MRPSIIINITIITLILSVVPSGIVSAQSQDKLILTVTPPFFNLTIGPGEFWASKLKVVNSNPYDLTLYASVMDFEADDKEGGQGKFKPVIKNKNENDKPSLAQWLEVSKESIVIPQGQSFEVPFSVRVPKNAEPGGHYAAILVGTQPIDEGVSGSVIRVASMVSSLLFVRIKGDVREEGYIREFLSEKVFYQKPKVNFSLRFENTGNVHLRPQGQVAIYNMWGKKIEEIPVNQKGEWGNILPQTTRKFQLKWEGENDVFEVGKYKAVAVAAYGKDARQNTSRITYFWVLPLKPALAVLGGFIFLILIISLAIRLYIKKTVRALQKAVVPAKPRPSATKQKKRKK